jgi:uncharacterized membrane protein YhdT
MDMWIELHLRFDEAVAAAEWSQVTKFLRLAAWCVSQESGHLPNDTSTAAVVAFYEHLPQNRVYWQHFPKWFSRSEFERLLPVFSYHLSENDFAEVKRSYAAAA